MTAGADTTTAAGRVLGIARRDAPRGPMHALESARISAAAGVEGDTRGRSGGRQVTVLSVAAWLEACAIANTDQPWLARRANVLIDGLNLTACAGALLCLGNDIELLVTGELAPCARMEAAAPGLRHALAADWRGGVTCRVHKGGMLAVGDVARLELRG